MTSLNQSRLHRSQVSNMLNETARGLFNFWFDKGINEGNWNDGTKFFYFYLCFNVLMANFSSQNSDRQMLNWLKREDSPLKRAFVRRLEYQPFVHQLQLLQEECPIDDSREWSNKRVNITDTANFNQVIECLYQVRCNFFHGNKPTSIERNQRIISASTHILKYWLEVIYTRGIR